MSFLYVGHTHEDVDQLFSRIAVALRKTCAPTPVEFAEVIKNSFTPSPNVIFLGSLANISHGVQSMVHRFPTGIMKYKQFQLSVCELGFPRFACRVNPHGSEIFRGIDDNSMFTPVFDGHILPWQGIDYTEIPPAQRKDPLTEDEVKKYKKTIRVTSEQWKLTANQLETLAKMLETLVDPAPIPFHWSKDSRMLPQQLEASVENDIDHDTDSVASQAPSGGSGTVWDEQHGNKAKSDPLYPFHIGDLVCVNNGRDTTDLDPFFLGKIVSVDNPPRYTAVEGADKDDRLLQVKWYDRATASKKKNKAWTESKYAEEAHLEWIAKKTVYCALEQGLAAAGTIRKNNHALINFYLSNPSLACGGDGVGEYVDPEGRKEDTDSEESDSSNNEQQQSKRRRR